MEQDKLLDIRERVGRSALSGKEKREKNSFLEKDIDNYRRKWKVVW